MSQVTATTRKISPTTIAAAPILFRQSGAVVPVPYVRTIGGSLAARDHFGGTAPQQVLAAIERARRT